MKSKSSTSCKHIIEFDESDSEIFKIKEILKSVENLLNSGISNVLIETKNHTTIIKVNI